MDRREFLQLLNLTVANGTLVRLGASAATMSLAGSLAAYADEPPSTASPQPPGVDPGFAGPPPEDAKAIENSYGLGDLQQAASSAVTAVTDAINADTHSVSNMPAPGSPLDLTALGGVTASVTLSGHADNHGDSTSKGVGVAVSFNPLTLDYGGEIFTVTGTGTSLAPQPGGSYGVELGLGSGDLSGFNGLSKTTSGSALGDAASVSTNATFAGIGIGVAGSPSLLPGLSTETTNTTSEIEINGKKYRIEGHGNLGTDISHTIKSVGDSTNALLNVGDALMNLVP